VRPDGVVRTVHNQARVDRANPAGRCGSSASARTSPKRKLAEEQVRASQERFRMMVENVRDYAIYILDMNGYVTSWNSGRSASKAIAPRRSSASISRAFSLADHAARGDPGMQLQFASIQGRYEARAGACARTGRSSGPT